MDLLTVSMAASKDCYQEPQAKMRSNMEAHAMCFICLFPSEMVDDHEDGYNGYNYGVTNRMLRRTQHRKNFKHSSFNVIY